MKRDTLAFSVLIPIPVKSFFLPLVHGCLCSLLQATINPVCMMQTISARPKCLSQTEAISASNDRSPSIPGILISLTNIKDNLHIVPPFTVNIQKADFYMALVYVYIYLIHGRCSRITSFFNLIGRQFKPVAEMPGANVARVHESAVWISCLLRSLHQYFG